MMRSLLLLLACVLLVGCGETGGVFVEVPLRALGTAPQTFVKEGWEVTLSEATLGFGPIYFCTTESALSSRCEAAVLELLDGVTLDGLDPEGQPIGMLFGTTGTIRTAFFDYGIVWLLTKPVPEALKGVPGGPADVNFESSSYVPGGHSARFLGTATCIEDAATCCPGAAACPSSYVFQAHVDVLVANPGTPAVNGARTQQEITTDPVELTIAFDPNVWWQSVDFGRLAALDGGAGLAVLGPSDPDYSALIAAMTANQLPKFVWSSPTTPQ
jgi:hypothetical protein